MATGVCGSRWRRKMRCASRSAFGEGGRSSGCRRDDEIGCRPPRRGGGRWSATASQIGQRNGAEIVGQRRADQRGAGIERRRVPGKRSRPRCPNPASSRPGSQHLEGRPGHAMTPASPEEISATFLPWRARSSDSMARSVLRSSTFESLPCPRPDRRRGGQVTYR